MSTSNGQTSMKAGKLRIEFLSQDDPLYILPFFEEFFRNYTGDFEILQVSISPAMGKRSRVQMIKELTTLYGYWGFAKLAIERVSSKLLGKLSATPSASRFRTIEQLCRAFDIPYQDINNPNSPDFLKALRDRAPDAVVSVACPFILKDEFLKTPAMGCINIHHAPLPRYKGMMPTFWQLYHGEKQVGVTVHTMVSKIDEGQILLQESLPVEAGETLDSLIRRSKRHGAHCMAKVLKRLAGGETWTLPPATTESSYFTFPTGDEIKEFHRRGYRAI